MSLRSEMRKELERGAKTVKLRGTTGTGQTRPMPADAKVIDVTPTWRGLLNTLLLLYTEGNATGRKTAGEELARMADLADLYVEHVKEMAANSPAEGTQYQIAEFSIMEGKWRLLAHGARYSATEARQIKVEREANSVKVMLLPC